MVPVLIACFILVPLAEIYVIFQVGQLIGFPETVLLLLVESLVGAWIVKREGRRAWVALREGIGVGRMPSRELLDAALVLVGGTMLLAPGFLTDIVGFFLVLPPTRFLARRLAAWIIARRIARSIGAAARAAGGAHRVVRGEVIDGDGRAGPS
jgi:UPF0716 protein FxsA